MKKNVVLVDRTVRMALGMVLLATPLLELPTYPFNLLGLVLIATAAAGYCPLYGFVSFFKAGPRVRAPKEAHASPR